MKIIRYSIIALSLCFILQSCSKKSHDPETGGPDPIMYGIIELWTGEVSIITVTDSPKIIKLTSSNDKVVQAAIQGNNITLTAGTPGSANLIITAEDGSTTTLEVHSITLTNLWRNLINDTEYKTSSVVQANDSDFAVSLKEQLLSASYRTYGFDFRPGVSENELRSFRQIYTNPAEITTGTFDFRELTLELNFTASKEVYKVIPVKNRKVLRLEQDLTEHYKALYPDKGVQKVIFIYHIQQYILPG